MTLDVDGYEPIPKDEPVAHQPPLVFAVLGFALVFVAFTAVFWWIYSYANSWWVALAVLTSLAVLSLTRGVSG
jgi:membrane protein insertase Oxa1/YidC/SpoIIIJ